MIAFRVADIRDCQLQFSYAQHKGIAAASPVKKITAAFRG
jgi:hypothetical protein